MLIPLSLLPGWVGPIAWVLAPTWGMHAIRDAALGGDVARRRCSLCLASQPRLHARSSLLLLHHFERLARARATLSLT